MDIEALTPSEIEGKLQYRITDNGYAFALGDIFADRRLRFTRQIVEHRKDLEHWLQTPVAYVGE